MNYQKIKNGMIRDTGYKSAINRPQMGSLETSRFCHKKRIPHNTDHTIYEFKNVYTGAEFYGTRKQFDKENSYRSLEVIKNIRIVNGWKLKGAIPKRIPKNKMNKASA